jgi:phosphoribosylanthranilate isomerase
MTQPIIYVERITNLSDARYCAGMGADMLGFVVNPADVDYVSPKHYQDMVGWISGPKRVAQIAGAEGISLEEVINNYKPDFIHIEWTRSEINLPDLPLLLEMSFTDLKSYLIQHPYQHHGIAHLIITNFPPEARHSKLPVIERSVLLSLAAKEDAVVELLEQTGVNGLVLQGSRELAPGLKDYDHLSRVLEVLEK